MIYGPNTPSLQAIIDRIPTLTEDECKRLNAAWEAAWNATRNAVLATVTYDLATEDGPYTIVQRDLLFAPWVEVCGMPEALCPTATLDGEG